MAQWVTIENQGKGKVSLQRFYSSFLNFRANDYYLTHFYGTWAGEMNCAEERLEPGIKSIESKKGVRTTQSENASFILSLDHPAQENSGRCIGGALAWSGNYKLSFEVDERDYLSLLAGINPFMSAYTLDRGERFETPKFLFTYSADGRGTVSRNFHDWARRYGLHAGTKERPILLNSWEGAYFDFDEQILTNMMDDAAELGVELFVLDDGWFGNKYPRNSATMGLGDWQVNEKKLPRGIQYLIDHATSKGLKFGIWIEPEMVNPKSELAERHPEWIVQSPGREQITMRNQLLLDLTNPDVQEFVCAYFDFDEQILTNMMDDAAELGVELFVLDDGWFGNKYPRNSATMGLGDWQVNEKKLPRGIQYLIDHATSKGLKFGIWIEPEMVNPKSELAERHPEWIVQSPGREQITMRNQLLLDLTNPDVQEFVWNVVDKLLSTYPDIYYIKWDANRHVEQVGSPYLLPEEQMHFWVDYIRGLYRVYDRIRAKYPDVMLQACASGGGRVDYGSLPYHDEFWTSDNTDALQRVYMQYATNLIYPPVATASHVSASPGHQTGSITPLKFRFDVAMSGRLGLELQPKDIPAEEMAFAREAIANYKTHIRELVTKGDLYRLISPYECTNNHAANMLVRKDKSKAVLFAYCTGFNRRGIRPTVHLHGLDASKRYRITEINKTGKRKAFWGEGHIYDGAYLRQVGIELQIARQYDSAVFLLEEVK